MRKDKKQVIGEEISDEAIKAFLAMEPADDTPPAVHKLLKAYRGLRIGDFERFLVFYREAGLDLGASADAFITEVQDQRQAEPYIEAIREARG